MLHAAVVPPHTLSWFPSGERVISVPGDILLVETADIEGMLVRFGERLRGKRKYAWTNHSAATIDGDEVAQATARGFVSSPLARYTPYLVCVVHPTEATAAQVRAAVELSTWSLGIDYGWWQVPLYVANCLTGRAIGLSTGDTMVCSSHACRTAERWGLIPDRSPWAVMPSTLAEYFEATP